MNTLWSFLYNLVLALWIGGMSVFTFIVTPAIFRSFGRDTAGEIVGKLFPGYFLQNIILSMAALVFFVLMGFSASGTRHRLSLFLIVAAILINLFVFFKLHPEIKKIKEEIHSFEALPAKAPARVQFGRLHAVSAVLNLIVLADGVVLILIGTVMRK